MNFNKYYYEEHSEIDYSRYLKSYDNYNICFLEIPDGIPKPNENKIINTPYGKFRVKYISNMNDNKSNDDKSYSNSMRKRNIAFRVTLERVR
jgi:hypothetical protein